MARRWQERVSERHHRRHGPGKARYIRQINWVTPQWPFAGWAGVLMAALALFLFVSFALYLPWYGLAVYSALVAVSAVLLRMHWPLWVRHTVFLTAFAGVVLLLLRITELYPPFLLALGLGVALSLWVSYVRERETRERDAFKRERISR